MRTPGLGLLFLIARFEPFFVLLTIVHDVAAFPLLFFKDPSLAFDVIAPPLLFVVIVVSIAEFRDWFRARTLHATTINGPMRTSLRSSLAHRNLYFNVNRIRIVPSDLSVSGHVGGVVYPRLYISGGLFVELLRRTNSSGLVVAHEIAHVRNLDRMVSIIHLIVWANLFFVAYVLLDYFINIDAYPIEARKLVLFSTVYAILNVLVVNALRRRREYLADAWAAFMTGSKSSYVTFLRDLGAERGGVHLDKQSWTHPTLRARLLYLSGPPIILLRNDLLLFFWVFSIIGAVLGFSLLPLGKLGSPDDSVFDLLYGYQPAGWVLFVVLIFGLGVELIRRPLAWGVRRVAARQGDA